jgi:hypothetical protein
MSGCGREDGGASYRRTGRNLPENETASTALSFFRASSQGLVLDDEQVERLQPRIGPYPPAPKPPVVQCK